MKLDFYAGKNKDGKEIYLDLKKQDLNLILLVGQTGSGKSIFHFNLYQQLLGQNTPEELSFLIIDNTRSEFMGFRESYLIKACQYHVHSTLELRKIQEELVLRSTGKKDKTKAILVHIEECDLFSMAPEEIQEFMSEFIRLKNESNIYLVYSTSRSSVAALPDYLIENADLKVVFKLASEVDCKRVLGNTIPLSFTKHGERILVLKETSYRCEPLAKEEFAGDEDYVSWKDATLDVEYLREVIASCSAPFSELNLEIPESVVEGGRLTVSSNFSVYIDSHRDREKILQTCLHVYFFGYLIQKNKLSHKRDEKEIISSHYGLNLGEIQNLHFCLGSCYVAGKEATDPAFFKEQRRREAEATNELYARARVLVTQTQKVSIPFLQRNLGIGYSKASQVMELLEKNNIVGKPENNAREVLVKE